MKPLDMNRLVLRNGCLAGRTDYKGMIAKAGFNECVGAQKLHGHDAGGHACGADAHSLRPHADQRLCAGACGQEAGRVREARRGNDVHGRCANEARCERCAGMGIEVVWRANLFDMTAIHEDDLVRHGHGLHLIVGHIDHGHSKPLLQRADLPAHLQAQLRVEVGEGLVHEAHGRLRHDGARQRHALLLAARELRGLTIKQRFQAEKTRRPRQPVVPLRAGNLPHPEAKDDVLGDTQMRKQRIALKDHGDAPLRGRQRRHVAPADQDAAGAGDIEPRDQAQGRGLAATGGAEQGEELACGHAEAGVRHGRGLAPELGDVIDENTFRHARLAAIRGFGDATTLVVQATGDSVLTGGDCVRHGFYKSISC